MALPNTGLGKHTTAQQALRGVNLSGKRAIVTGANSGIGVETARALASAGADVLLAVRNVEAGEKIAAELRGTAKGKISVGKLDLTDLASVRAFATEQVKTPFDLLINNAGIMATPLGKTAQGHEQQMGVNHLGHFLLTKLLLPALRPGGRVVNVSSNLHARGTAEGVLGTLRDDRDYSKRKYGGYTAYGDSKLANVLFTKGLAKRGTAAFAIHPGVIATNLMRHNGFTSKLMRIFGKPFLKTAEEGAATSVFAATAPELEGKSGLYLADCNEAKGSRFTHDEALVETVWEISETLTRDFA